MTGGSFSWRSCNKIIRGWRETIF